jgi:hypothetical protein
MTMMQIQESQGFTLDGYYYQITSVDEEAETINTVCTDNQRSYEFSFNEINQSSNLNLD